MLWKSVYIMNLLSPNTSDEKQGENKTSSSVGQYGDKNQKENSVTLSAMSSILPGTSYFLTYSSLR